MFLMCAWCAPRNKGNDMPLTATTTDYSGIDSRTGKACHKGGHTREASGYIRKARKADALGLAIAAGQVSARTGVGTCALCGGAGTLANTINARGTVYAGPRTLVLCHDTAQHHGGAVCWCSMVLGHQSCNLAQGDLPLTDFDLHTDARDYARAGGLWTPWEGSRDSFSYGSTRAARTRTRADGWMPRTPAAVEVVQRLAFSSWQD